MNNTEGNLLNSLVTIRLTDRMTATAQVIELCRRWVRLRIVKMEEIVPGSVYQEGGEYSFPYSCVTNNENQKRHGNKT